MAESSKRSYSNGRIYCIRNSINDDIYVGSSCQPLSKRMEHIDMMLGMIRKHLLSLQKDE